MTPKNKNLSLLSSVLIIIVSGYGLFLNSGLPQKFNLKMLLYFTILSNLLCFVYFIIVCVQRIKNQDLNMNIKGGITLSITITMLVYWILLAPTQFVMGSLSNSANLTVHLYVPLLVIFDYLCFDKKGCFSKQAPLLWLLMPLIYYILTLIAYSLNVSYINNAQFPYFFIDHTLIGAFSVLINILGLIIAFSLASLGLYKLDHILKIKTK